MLTDGYYDKAMDMWGVGCVTFEVLALFPIFPGSNELDQIAKIHEVLGTPPEHVLDKMRRRGSAHRHLSYQAKHGSGIASLIPHASGAAVDLIEQLLAYDPDDRCAARALGGQSRPPSKAPTLFSHSHQNRCKHCARTCLVRRPARRGAALAAGPVDGARAAIAEASERANPARR